MDVLHTRKLKVIIRCNDRLEDKIEINRTGKIKLKGNCKLMTADITTQQQLKTRYIHAHQILI